MKPETGVASCNKVKVAPVIVVASMVLLKEAAICWFNATLTAPSAGSVALTVGGVMTP